MLSKNFISLIESMKSSYSEIDEDKDAKAERGEERRKNRREDKFGVSTNSTTGITGEIQGDSDFKIRPFSRAVQQLKSQVQSEIFGIDQTINNRNAGFQGASVYKAKFNKIEEIISTITSKLDLIKDKEGRNLEAKDIADIKLFRGLYSTAANDFLAAQKEWADKKSEEENKYLSDLKDTDTNSLLISSDKAFEEAEAMLKDLIRFSQQAIIKDQKGGDKGAENLATGDIIKAGKKYDKDSKEGKIVIEVKKTIYKKFKSKLGSYSDWKVVYKSGVDNVSGSLLGNTQALIVFIKGGLFKTGKYPQFESDKGGDITPAFIAAINGLTESQSNSFGKLITFENFIKRHVNEDFEFDIKGGEEALSNFKKSSGSSSNSGGNSNSGNSNSSSVQAVEYGPTPFKTEEEGNKFREWVIKKNSDWATKNKLDAKGSYNNIYIKKAWSEFGKDYNKVDEVIWTGKQMNTLLSKIKSYNKDYSRVAFTMDDKPYVQTWIGKKSTGIYNNGRVSYTLPGKIYWGKLIGTPEDPKSIKFDSGKTAKIPDFAKCQIDFKEDPQYSKNFTELQYNKFATQLLDAMAGAGTTTSVIKSIFNTIKSEADLKALNSAFGVKREQNLEDWLYYDNVLRIALRILVSKKIPWYSTFKKHYNKESEKSDFQ